MKKIISLMVTFVFVLGFIACEDNDNLEFTVQAPQDSVAFTNTLLNEYIITPQTSGNIAERFVWNSVVFIGTATEVTYDLQVSITQDFASFESLGTTNDTHMSVTVDKLLALAETAGLDNDPTTDDKPNMGLVYFRVRAFVGNGGTDAPESISDIMVMNITLPEITQGSGIEISSWGIVGSGYNDWGNAGPDAPFYTTNTANVLVAYVTLLDGEIKLRENNEWTNNLGDDGADGTLEVGGANIVSSAGTYKITLDLNTNTYTIESYSWGIIGSGFNDWGNDGPDAEFHYDYTTDTFKVGVKLLDGEIKFRLNNNWTTNYGGTDGNLAAGGDNIVSTAGFYQVTIDFNNNTYTIEANDVWGIIGSGYNDWGNNGPDFNFTQVNPGIYIANNVTLLDGEIKFRLNEDWTTNFGDDGNDGTLEAEGANIPSTAGKFRITMDLSDNSNPTYTISSL
ncbi:SusE domain-containing protein [Tenacibaculum sp. MAR_2009_124]|uniref:SusE domain-containing protein n=1 Tax=Tenacibaculum sp. MAR_2009_124 TaxID=1250059 RepID=UPI000B8A0162|nr:SusE domain-containing protein [Tenacibaculum sp. MAR_2009_124]